MADTAPLMSGNATSMADDQDTAFDSRRRAVAIRMIEAGKATTAFCVGRDGWCAGRAIEKAIRQAEAAFARDDFDTAEHLAAVVLCMCKRAMPKFQADPKAWLAAMRAKEAL